MENAKFVVKDKDTQAALEHVFANAMGPPIIFQATPSLANMKANSWGIFSTTLYLKFANGSGISIAGVALT